MLFCQESFFLLHLDTFHCKTVILQLFHDWSWRSTSLLSNLTCVTYLMSINQCPLFSLVWTVSFSSSEILQPSTLTQQTPLFASLFHRAHCQKLIRLESHCPRISTDYNVIVVLIADS